MIAINMLVVDTFIWIERLIGGALKEKIIQHMPSREKCIVPTIVQLELYKCILCEQRKEAEAIISYINNCIVVPLDTPIALKAAELCKIHKLATADAAIYVTALHMEAELITCDTHFSGLPYVTYITKSSYH